MDMTEQVEIAFRTHISYHIVHTYGALGHLQLWVAVEVLSFGALSKLFSNMKNKDKNHIAKTNYQAPSVYLESWLKCLSYIRDICAHYGRLYNRPLTSKP